MTEMTPELLALEEKMKPLLEEASKKRGVISSEELMNHFRGENLSPEQMDHIYEFLDAHKVDVLNTDDSEELSPDFFQEEKEDEIANIRNGLNYARKVLATGQFDALFLDEVMELISLKVITAGELEQILSARGFTDVFLTGHSVCEEAFTFVDEIIELKSVQFKNYS